MERKIVIALMLILQLAGVFGFYITQGNNQSAIYEVKEDETSHTLTITSTQPEKPILREIIYYHIIEKPYEQVNSIKHDNIPNNSKTVDKAYETSNVDNVQTDYRNITISNYVTSNEDTNDIDNITIVSDNSKIEKVDTNENTADQIKTADNEENVTDSDDVDAKEEMSINKNISAVADKNTIDKYISNDKNITTNYDNDESVSVMSLKNTLKDKDNGVILEDLANATDIKRKKYETATGNNTTATVTTTDLITEMISDHVTINSNKNITYIDNKTDTEIKNEVENATIEVINLNNDNDIGNLYVTGNLIDTDIFTVDDSTKNNDISGNTNNLTKETVIDIEPVDDKLKDMYDGPDTGTKNTDEINGTFIINNDHLNTAHENQLVHKNTTSNDEISKEFNKNYDIVDNSIINNKDEIINHSYEIIHKTNESEKEIMIENDIYSKPTENKSNIENKDNQKITNEDDNNAFIIIVDDSLTDNNIIDDEYDDNNNNKGDNVVDNHYYDISKHRNIIGKDNNEIDADTIHNDFLIYVEDDYKNPYDGKEGVSINDRHFTNGHGFQYFYPDPESQGTSEYPAPANEENENIANPNRNDAPNDPEKVEELEDKKIAVSLEENQENVDTLDKKRRKRDLATALSVNEDYAPEDMLKNVMDKASGRMTRSVDTEGTYGMTLTGNKGVVWNNLDDQKLFYPVGENSYYVEDSKDMFEYDFNDINDNKENNEIVHSVDSGAEDKQELRIENIKVEGSNVIDSSKEGYGNKLYNNIAKLSTEQLNQSGKTYGMSLTSGHGSVWNDLGDSRIMYDIGELQNKVRLPKEVSEDDEIINKQIEAFHNFFNEAPLTGNSNFEETSFSKTSTENVIFNNQTPSTQKPIKQAPSTEKPITKAPSTEKPITKAPGTEKSNDVQSTEAPKIREPIIVEPKTEEQHEGKPKLEELSDINKTYGMSLTEDQGVVWNDLNGHRVSYHVGDQNESISKLSKDDELINEKIHQFQNSLTETPFFEETITDKPSTHSDIVEPITYTPKVDLITGEPITKTPNIEPFTEEPVTNTPKLEPFTEEPITKIPKIEPLTEEPIIYEPVTEDPNAIRPIVIGPNEKPTTNEPTKEPSSTEKQDDPVKTYGMSLTGDHGIVWNDLNGNRVSYHVGEPNSSVKEDEHNETPLKPNSQDSSNLIDEQKDKTEELLNDTDAGLTEVDNIIEEFTDETQKAKNDTKTAVADEIISLVKEACNNETTKLQDKLKDWIKEQVAKQIEEYFLAKSLNNSIYDKNDNRTEIVGEKDKTLDEEVAKKNKDCDEKKKDKESPIKVSAKNIYGNSVGNDNVTNIFIFNINNISDVNDIIKPINNGTNGIILYETDNEKPVKEEIKEEEYNIETTTEINAPKPDEENVIDQASENSKENFNETEDKNDQEHENSGASTPENANKPTNTILEENQIKNPTAENVTDPDATQNNLFTETLEEPTETITDEDNENVESETAETTEEITSVTLEESDIKDTSTEKTNLDFGNDEISDTSKEVNKVPEKEPNGSTEQQNAISEELIDVSENLNVISEEKPNDQSEEKYSISEELHNTPEEKNDISDELNGIPEKETNDISKETNDISEDNITPEENSNEFSEEINDTPAALSGFPKEIPNDQSEETSSISEELNSTSEEKPNYLSEETNDISEELNGIPEKEPNDISKETNNISEDFNVTPEENSDEFSEEINDTSEELSGFPEEIPNNETEENNSISEELNSTPEETPNYLSEETNDISEELNISDENNNISEDLNLTPEEKSNEFSEEANNILEELYSTTTKDETNELDTEIEIDPRKDLNE